MVGAAVMEYPVVIAERIGIRQGQAAAAIALLDEGNTLPFIARYRKEATQELDEDQLRRLCELLERLRSLDKRRETILASIAEQEKLTPQLEQQILAAESLTALEDLYQPYKPKRHTRASQARERGLQPLADLILSQARISESLDALAQPYLSDAVPDWESAWAGARDIVAEAISDHPDVRRITRQKTLEWGVIHCQKIDSAEDPRQVYALYYEFEIGVSRAKPHQILALNRGESEKVLRLSVSIPERDWQAAIQANFPADPRSGLAQQLQMAAIDAAERLLLPAIERDVRRSLTESGERHAIQVFANNLSALLRQPPLVGYTVIGLDPGFRTGCKVAVVDPTGRTLETTTIYPHEPQKQWVKAKTELASLILRHHASLIAIGNGTASRETELLAAELIHEVGMGKLTPLANNTQPAGLHYLITNEAGASVYSASELARGELPDLDVSLRGAVSIARRVQDPLAELVKIDAKAIGVGMYQHDVDQKLLAETLQGVVESVVNQVGVDVNSASPALLTHVAGIGPKLANKIVAHRDASGAFKNRQELNQVSGMGPKAFEQCAGFLRVRDGDNLLDASAIHPESYPAAEKLLNLAEIRVDMPLVERRELLDRLFTEFGVDLLAAEVGTGIPTLLDIYEQLLRPGRDPRQDLPTPVLRSDILKIEDLTLGMRLKGTVRNVVDFGVFVDIGVKQDGLLHRSQMPRGTLLQVGDVIEVEVIKIEIERGRIALKMN